MKVQLWTKYSDRNSVNGYLNAYPINSEFEIDHEHYKITKLSDLEFVCNAEAEEIVSNLVVGCVPAQDVLSAIQNWTNKLCRGGTLKIIDIDASRIVADFYFKKIGVEEFNGLLYGAKDDIIRTNCLTIGGVCNYLIKLGYKITRKEILDNYTYMIEGIKQ